MKSMAENIKCRKHENEIIGKFKKMPYHLKAVALGTTQCHFALDFAAAGYEGFNMACYLNPMQFNRLLLEQYQAHLAKGAVVLITLQYPIFCIDDIDRIARCNVQQYAKILPGKNSYCPLLRQMVEYVLPVRKKTQMNMMLENMRFLEKRNKYRNHFKAWELKKQCEDLVRLGWEKEIRVPDYVKIGHLQSNKRCESAMEFVTDKVIELVELCRKKNWRPVLLGLPYSKVLNEYVPRTFKEYCFYQNIDRIINKTGCDFWDYSANEELQNIHNYMVFESKRARKVYI